MTASISDTLIDVAFAPNLTNGERYLSTTNGERYLSTTNGERYLSTTNGERYLSTTNGERYLSTTNGERYVSSTNGERYLSTTNGERYLSTTNGERYLSTTKGICSPRLEHIFKRSLVMTAHVDLLLTCSTVSGTRMPPQITVFIHCVIPLNECPFSNPLGLLARGSPHLRLRALVLLYSGKI